MPGSSPKSPSPAAQDAPAVEGALIADTDQNNDNDNDSTIGFSDTASLTASLTSSIMQYRIENGRSYHAYKEGTYVLPNDDSENDRLELQHHLFTLTLQGDLHLAPIGKTKQVHRVLDAGTGTGSWAMDFADEHPESHVIGVDLSPIQPSFVPPNVSFYVDDVEEQWTYSTKFDFVYIRMLTGSIADWPKFFRQSYENLNPGGWVEAHDITFPITSDDGTLKPESALSEWSNHMKQAADNLGRSLESAKFYKAQMEEAGFVNVVEAVYKWPMNTWPRDRRYKELGMWACENITSGLSGLSLALFTRGLKWNATELEVYLINVRREMKDHSIHSYWPIYFVYGQKPETADAA